MHAVSEVIPLFTYFRESGLKGGNRSRWQRKKGKQQNVKRRKEKGIKRFAYLTTSEIFRSHNPKFNPGGEFSFSSRFFNWLRC